MKNEPMKTETSFSQKIGSKESLKLKAKGRTTKEIWASIGMFGLVGWSVAFPTVAGALLGIWLDKHCPIKHSWTIALLVAGLILGCLCAWYWIAKEDKAIRKDRSSK